MVGNSEPFGLGHRVLTSFNFRIVKLLDPTAIKADQVVVMLAFVEFVDSLAALKVTARQNAGLFKLRQYPVHRGQTYI